MSHKHGAYLGGIRTVEDLRLRCYVDECTGCWHWRLAMDDGFALVHFVAPDTGERKKTRGRRAALWLANGHDIGPGRVAAAHCESSDCVNPAHAKSMTNQQLGREITGTYPPRAGLPIRGRKLTPAQVIAIRAGGKSCEAWARELGLASRTVWAARVGETFRYLPPATPTVFSLGSRPASSAR